MSNIRKLLESLEQISEQQPLSREDAANTLEELAQEIDSMVEEAYQIVRRIDNHLASGAKSYWYGHIKSAVGSDDYPTYATTMQTTINDLRGEDEDSDQLTPGWGPNDPSKRTINLDDQPGEDY